MNSNRKGKVYEREIAAYLREHGYYDKKPMPVIATEKHISTATAWRYERIGVASICAI